MALPYDFVMCAFMLLLTVHGVVLGLRDIRYHATLDCAWRCLGLRVMCAFMLLLTVHGVVLGLRDKCAFVLLLTVHGVVV